MGINGDLLGYFDGWKARPFISATSQGISVWLELILQGEVQTDYSKCVWYCETRTEADLAERAAQLALWSAVARFMNCGGDLYRFHEALAGVLDAPAISFAGYRLYDYQEHVADVTYIFQSRTEPDQYVVWEEDVIIERGTAEAVGLVRLNEEPDDSEDVLDTRGAHPEEQDLPDASRPRLAGGDAAGPGASGVPPGAL